MKKNQIFGLVAAFVVASAIGGVAYWLGSQSQEKELPKASPFKLTVGHGPARDKNGKIIPHNTEWNKTKKRRTRNIFAAKQPDGSCSAKLNRSVLEKSLTIGTDFIVNNQRKEGNFNYEYDWRTKKFTEGDNAVRQAGATWGLAMIYQFTKKEKVKKALDKALAFFDQHSVLSPDGRRYVVYPGDPRGALGTVALITLAHTDLLRALPKGEEYDRRYKRMLEYREFIKSAERDDGLFHSRFTHEEGKPIGPPSPYFDGESLLALIKSAKAFGFKDEKDWLMKLADAGYQLNVQDALAADKDSNTTKGYYQWSSMAFFELFDTGWSGTDKYGGWVLELANWMIDVHKTLVRTRNTAYAYEGIVHAYEVAKRKNEKRLTDKFKCVIDQGLETLTSWQVGSPIGNRYIAEAKEPDKFAHGGIQNHRRESTLRIDVGQHQMAAVMFALTYTYK